MIAAVHLDRAVLRALRRLPRHVADKLFGWVAADPRAVRVEQVRVIEVHKHDY